MGDNDSLFDTGRPLTEKEKKALEKRAIEVVKPLIPPDAEDRVKRTVKQFNDIVRKHIRSETGLKLASETSNESVPIKVVKGFPTQIAQLINKNDEILLWRLITIQPKLGGVVEGLNVVLDSWEDFSNWDRLPEIARDQSETIRRTRDISLELQKLAAAKRIINQVKEIHEDIFGAYIYTNYSQTIHLYWMALAIFSSSFGVRIEDLTVVVLAHELAHAYTHIGKDIDGGKWNYSNFAKTDTYVKEGLAQYYTCVICDRLTNRAPLVFEAYEKLLNNQSGPYTEHNKWIVEIKKRQKEIIRQTMLRARNENELNIEKWRELMKETTAELR